MKAWPFLLTVILLCPVACTGPERRTVYVELSAIGNLKEGAPVRFGGTDIGIVEKLTLLRSTSMATLLIQRKDAPVQSNDRVAVHPIGLFGAEVIDIIPSPAEGRPLRNGDTEPPRVLWRLG